MRLLNIKTKRLEEYFGTDIPDYAILSHCWGDGEVTFDDVNVQPLAQWLAFPGAAKIKYASSQCKQDGLSYVWIDTCCIDKGSSAELSEAINSMYSWYENSSVCYTYLKDVKLPANHIEQLDLGQLDLLVLLRRSRWFYRGWTLQELIAPKKVKFYDAVWAHMGDKVDLCGPLSGITSIPEAVLLDPRRRLSCSVARKMSWAAGRKTTRVEDTAYSLLGVFEVNMPLLYGEGERAFARLQEEILKVTDDQSLFAWGLQVGPDRMFSHSLGVLADGPDAFLGSGNIVPTPTKVDRPPYAMTNKGLRIELALWTDLSKTMPYDVAMLDCRFETDFSGYLGIPLKSTSRRYVYHRQAGCGVRKYTSKQILDPQTRMIYLDKHHSEDSQQEVVEFCLVRSESMHDNGYQTVHVAPRRYLWNSETTTMKLEYDSMARISKWPIWAYFVFQTSEKDIAFAVFLGLSPFSSLLNVQSRDTGAVVKILPKPSTVPLQDFLDRIDRALQTEGLKHYRYLTQHDLIQVYDEQGRARDVSARVGRDDMLNQSVLVLVVEMKVAEVD